MNKNLTTGVPGKVLINFTIPLFISVIFQQMYNIADSIIAGKFAGESALAAIGASYPITMIFMAVAVGCQIGCSVVISRYFGSGDYGRTKLCITTSLTAGFVLSAFLTVLGVAVSGLLIHLLNTPSDIFSDARLYLQIYTGGFVFLFIYNVTTGIFNSLGDSKTPLFLLMGSSIGNIVLDAVFVIVFKWGIAGVAWATFIAQGISGILSVIILAGRMKSIKSDVKQSFFSWKALGEISTVAGPSILQQSFISIGNLFIQYMVNGFGSSVIAGYSAAIKLNTFAITSFTTFGNGISSFTAQNIGAGKTKRVTDGFKSGCIFALVAALAFALAYSIFSKQFLMMFMNDESTALAVETGMKFMKIVSPFYLVVCVKLICDGVLRGSESMKLFMTATFTDLILRVVLASVFKNFWGETGIWIAWPISWTIASAMSVVFYKKRLWIKS